MVVHHRGLTASRSTNSIQVDAQVIRGRNDHEGGLGFQRNTKCVRRRNHDVHELRFRLRGFDSRLHGDGCSDWPRLLARAGWHHGRTTSHSLAEENRVVRVKHRVRTRRTAKCRGTPRRRSPCARLVGRCRQPQHRRRTENQTNSRKLMHGFSLRYEHWAAENSSPGRMTEYHFELSRDFGGEFGVGDDE